MVRDLHGGVVRSLARCLAGEVHQPAGLRLHEALIAPIVSVGAFRPESSDGGVDQVGALPLERFVAEAESIHGGGA